MHCSEVMDISTDSSALKVGDSLTITKFNVVHDSKLDADFAEIDTTNGKRHTYGKVIVGQAKSDYWNDIVKKCLEKNPNDGLDVWVIEKDGEGTDRKMLCLTMFQPS